MNGNRIRVDREISDSTAVCFNCSGGSEIVLRSNEMKSMDDVIEELQHQNSLSFIKPLGNGTRFQVLNFGVNVEGRIISTRNIIDHFIKDVDNFLERWYVFLNGDDYGT